MERFGTKPKSAAARSAERRVLFALTLGPPLLSLALLPIVVELGVRAADVANLVIMHALVGSCVSVGYHRLFAHRSFTAPTAVRVALAIGASMAFIGPVARWVADHRRHHAFADREGDPHSPAARPGSGVGERLRALWHSHVGWFFDYEKTSVSRYASDVLEDKAILWVDAHYFWWIGASLALPALLGLCLTWSWQGAVTGFIWGGPIRMFLMPNSVWFINSICHSFGTRAFRVRDGSRNVWWMVLVTFGESWHNNHHAFPRSARFGHLWWQVDTGWWLIRALEKLGLASDPLTPSRKVVTARRAA